MKNRIGKTEFLFFFFLSIQMAFAGNQTSEATISTYFNNNDKNSYVDPYRNIVKNGDNFEEIIVSEINKAQKSILIAVQEFRLPSVARALVDLKKNHKGMDIRVVIDNKYNNIPSNYTVEEIQAMPEYERNRMLDYVALIDVNNNGKFELEEKNLRDAMWILKENHIALIDDTFDNPKAGLGSLMHHKFVVVDGKTVIITSANFTLSDIHGDITKDETRGNLNSLVLIHNLKAAAIYREEFEYMWSGKFGLKKPFRGTQIVSMGKGLTLKIHFSPTPKSVGHDESTNGLIMKELATAQKSVNLALFVFSEQNISNLLETLYLKKVDLKVLVEPLFAYREYSQLLDMWGLEILNKNCQAQPNNHLWKKTLNYGGVVNLPEGDMLHHKFAVIDDTRVIMGSQNWSEAANSKNDESLVVIEDHDVNQAYQLEYARLAKSAKLGAPKRLIEAIEERERECTHQEVQF